MQSESEKGTTEAHRIQRRDTPEREQARRVQNATVKHKFFLSLQVLP